MLVKSELAKLLAFFLSDDARQEHNKINKYMENYIEYRYEEKADEYFLKKWADGRETSSRGLLIDLPEWLVNIITIAKIGGHAKPIVQPPPNFIVWFNTDLDGNLIKFIELEK
jgi:hypothetical protein